jgi:TPR repeat protein
MQRTGSRPGSPSRAAGLLLVLAAALSTAAPARADLYSAAKEYQQGHYSVAFKEFLSLAKLGQPLAQLNIAEMYDAGQGTAQSDIHAYAWASLAEANGEAGAKALAEQIRPTLAPGSERIAGWIAAPYTQAALRRNLLPIRAPAATASQRARAQAGQCRPAAVDRHDYPAGARLNGTEGDVVIEFTVMSDGRARLPRVILGIPPDVFDRFAADTVLHSRFDRLAAGATPIHCAMFLRFKDWVGSGGSQHWTNFVDRTQRQAKSGQPMDQLLYGMLLVGLPQLGKGAGAGLPWFLKAAQAGLPLAQFEVGSSLLYGYGCEHDHAKAILWLRMAAAQNEPHAEIELALQALNAEENTQHLRTAKSWLESAAAQGSEDGKLYLAALLAASPATRVRDPTRALELLKGIFSDVRDDPTAYEIRAAARAAQGDFAHAVASERKAIREAKDLHWDLSPLEQRLASYRAGKPWYGDLLVS